jgi:hypothetical protein
VVPREAQQVPYQQQDWYLAGPPQALPTYYPAEVGGVAYPAMNMGFPAEFQSQSYPDERRFHGGEVHADLMPQDHSNLFQTLESTYQDPGANVLGQVSMYQGEDQQLNPNTRHGPHLRDALTLQYSHSEPFSREAPEPEARELAVQNAKAYLLQTSVNCDLSL